MGQERCRPVVTDHDVARSLAFTIEGERVDALKTHLTGYLDNELKQNVCPA